MSSPSSVRNIWSSSDGTAVDVSRSSGAFPLRSRHSKSVGRKCRLLTRKDPLLALPDRADCCLAVNVAETCSDSIASSHLHCRFESEVDAIAASVPMQSILSHAQLRCCTCLPIWTTLRHTFRGGAGVGGDRRESGRVPPVCRRPRAIGRSGDGDWRRCGRALSRAIAKRMCPKEQPTRWAPPHAWWGIADTLGKQGGSRPTRGTPRCMGLVGVLRPAGAPNSTTDRPTTALGGQKK